MKKNFFGRMAVVVAVTAACSLALFRDGHAQTVSNFSTADVMIIPPGTSGGIHYTNSNRGLQGEMYLGNIGLVGQTESARILFQFSLANIPAGQVITQAVLRLGIQNSQVFGGILTSDYYRVLASWTEGNGGAGADIGPTAGTSGATWSSRDKAGSLSWTVPGAFGAGTDREATKSFTLGPSDAVVVSGGYHLFKDVTTDVQAWYTGAAANYGWVGTANPFSADSDGYATRNTGTGGFAPLLIISYIPEPTTVGLLAIGGVLLWMRRRG